jgi:MFS family permease
MTFWNKMLTDPYARQFAPDGDGYLYRKNQREAPVRTTAAERDAFVDEFARATKWTLPLLLAGMILLPFLGVAIAMTLSEAYQIPLLVGGLVLVIAPYAWVVMRSWNAAARAVAGRPVLGERRSSEEWKHLQLGALSYKWMAFMALFGVYQVASSFLDPNRSVPLLNTLRLVVGIGLLAVVAVQGFRKYRVERAG